MRVDWKLLRRTEEVARLFANAFNIPGTLKDLKWKGEGVKISEDLLILAATVAANKCRTLSYVWCGSSAQLHPRTSALTEPSDSTNPGDTTPVVLTHLT